MHSGNTQVALKNWGRNVFTIQRLNEASVVIR